MITRAAQLVATLTATLLSACTTYVVSSPVSVSDAPHTGVLYSLPMLQHVFTVTRTITSCDPNLIKIGTEVDVENAIVPDPDAMFELDYTELSSATSTSKLDYRSWREAMNRSRKRRAMLVASTKKSLVSPS